MLDGQPTATITPEDAMQAAVDLLWHQTDDPEQYALATARAQVLVSMGRELRLGKTKMRKYGDVNRPQAAPPGPPQGTVLLELSSSREEEQEPTQQASGTEGTGGPSSATLDDQGIHP
jgi:hypothetical protein